MKKLDKEFQAITKEFDALAKKTKKLTDELKKKRQTPRKCSGLSQPPAMALMLPR